MMKDAMSKRSLPAKTSGDCCAGGMGLGDIQVANLEANGTWSDDWFLISQGRLTKLSLVFCRMRGASRENFEDLVLMAGHHLGQIQYPRGLLLPSDERLS